MLKQKQNFLAMRRNTISGCLLESVSLGKIPLRESQSNLRKDTLNYDLNYIDYPNINDVELTTGLKLLVLWKITKGKRSLLF